MAFSAKEKKFREVYSDYYPLVYRMLYKKSKTIEDAEDICHEIFVALYNRFEEVENYKSWLYGAVNFSVSSYYKRKSTRTADSVDIDDAAGSPELQFENGARDLRIILNEAIENDNNYKDEKQRLIFEMVALNKFTYEHTAKQLGISKRQAEYGYRQAVNSIIDDLKKKGISNIEDLL